MGAEDVVSPCGRECQWCSYDGWVGPCCGECGADCVRPVWVRPRVRDPQVVITVKVDGPSAGTKIKSKN